MEALGIEKLPVISQRIKQNLKEIPIDENGFIDDDDDDSYNNFVADQFLLVEDDYIQARTKRKRSPQSLRSAPPKKAKVMTQSNLECSICTTYFSRKDNLACHMKNGHKGIYNIFIHYHALQYV